MGDPVYAYAVLHIACVILNVGFGVFPKPGPKDLLVMTPAPTKTPSPTNEILRRRAGKTICPGSE